MYNKSEIDDSPRGPVGRSHPARGCSPITHARLRRETAQGWCLENDRSEQGAAMARQWLALNRVRAVLALAGWLAALKALSLPE